MNEDYSKLIEENNKLKEENDNYKNIILYHEKVKEENIEKYNENTDKLKVENKQ